MDNEKKASLALVGSAVIFGTIGLFVRWIGLPSGLIACVRGLMGACFLMILMAVCHQKWNMEAMKKNAFRLIASGMAIGFNWILLFEAYRHTTVAVATLCYYMAPVFVILLSPVLLKERMSRRQGWCVPPALLGALLVSGVLEGGGGADMTGILLGLGAAMFYASVIMMNRTVQGVTAEERTSIQLLAAGLTALPYTLLAESHAGQVTPLAIVLLVVVGCFHTGWAYALYFGALSRVKASKAAVISYVDPAVAILLSAVLLGEPMSIFGLIGAVLIIGSAIISSLPEKEE